MKGTMTTTMYGLFAALVLSLMTFAPPSWVGLSQVQQKPDSLFSADAKQAITSFENRVKDYVKLRNRVKERLPKLSKDSTPEQLEAYRKSFEHSLRAARAGAKRGDLFTPEAMDYIRRTLKTEFQGKDRAELREIVFEAENKTIPLRVNYPYPETKELTEMP